MLSARRDAVVLTVLITAVLLLIWNGSTFFNHLRIEAANFASDVRIASTALTLNVALILFGWRRYVDLQHEAEVRAEQERRAALLATTDPIDRALQPQGLCRSRGAALRSEAVGAATISSSSRSRSSASSPSTTSTAMRPATGC